MKPRKITDPLVYTNILFFINGLLYGTAGHMIVCCLFIISSFFSYHYHRSQEKDFVKVDQIAATLALISVIFLVMPTLSNLEICFLLGWLIPCFVSKAAGSENKYISESNYRFYHVVWHVLVFLGNLFAWAFAIQI